MIFILVFGGVGGSVGKYGGDEFPRLRVFHVGRIVDEKEKFYGEEG